MRSDLSTTRSWAWGIVLLVSVVWAPALRAQLKIEASRGYYEAALRELKPEEREIVVNGFGLNLELSNTVYEPVRSEGNGRVATDLFAINHASFVAFYLANLRKRDTSTVTISKWEDFSKGLADWGQYNEIFALKLTTRDAAGNEVVVARRGAGPTYNGWKSAAPDSAPGRLLSCNVAYFSAFLRCLIRLEHPLPSRKQA
jgi:hypothetical protein